MMEWFVYIILTKKDRLYTGITTNPDRRFQEHLTDKKKGAKYFRTDKPLKIVYLEKFSSKSNALKREIEIKKMSKTSKSSLLQD